MAVESGLGYTEEKAIRGVTVTSYQRFFTLLLIFLGSMGVWQTAASQMSPAELQRVAKTDQPLLDASLVDYFDHLYFTGCQASDAEKTKASLCHYVTFLDFNRDLPRAARALQGFRKIAPGNSRFPLPRVILGALMGQLAVANHFEMALALALMFIAYLRPSELLNLRVCDVLCWTANFAINLAPRNTDQYTQTGSQDEAIRLANQIWPSLAAALLSHVKDLGYTAASAAMARVPLWTLSYQQFKDCLDRAAKALKLPDGFCPYMARLGGATTDVLEKFRSWPETQARGRWAAESTLRLCVKQDTVAAYLNGCDEEVINYGQKMLEDPARLVRILLGREALWPPSLKAVRARRVNRNVPMPAAMKAASPMKVMKVMKSLVEVDVMPAAMKTMKVMKMAEVAPMLHISIEVKSVAKAEAKVDAKVMRVAPPSRAMKVVKTMKRRAPAMKAMKAARVSVVMKAAMRAVPAMKAMRTMKAGKIMKAMGRPAAAHVRRRPAAVRRRK